MKHVSLKAICALALILVSVSVVFAGNGKITGVVKDSSNGEPIVGANIVLEGTSLGGATNLQGVYVILNVPPGSYNIRASAVGFAAVVIKNIQVNSDQTVTEDLRLSSKSFELREVVVEAERKLVDKTLTSTRTVVSMGELNNNLPILSVQELLNTTASVFKGRIRGSQKQETKTLMDGIDITDQFGNVAYLGTGDDLAPAQVYNRVTKAHESAGTMVDMNSSSLSEVSVIAGAANAEYVSATAGVYSANLREGRGAWNGRVFFRTGGGGLDRFMKGAGSIGPEFYPAADTAKYFTNKRSLALSNPAKSARYIWTPGKYDIAETPTIDAEISLGGSVAENFGLFFTGRLNDSHGTMPNEFNREANLTLKANYDFTKTMKFVFSGVLQDRGQLFGWKNRTYNDASRFFLEGVPVNDGYSAVLSGKFTQFLSQESFYEVQVSHVKKSGRIGFLDAFTNDANGNPTVYDQRKGSASYLVLGYDTAKVRQYIGALGSGKFFNNNNDDPNGLDATIVTIANSSNVLANPTYYYENVQTSVTTLKADIVSQLTANHQVRAGAQVRLHSISQDRRSTVISPTEIDPAVGVLTEQYDKKPIELGFYAQDRIEFSGIIVNVGARLEEFDPDAAEFSNFYTPYLNPLNNTFNAGFKSDFVPYRGTAISPKWFFSPRIGVSHPISEDATMYFSFSRSSQPLPFSRMYLGYNNINNTSLPIQVRTNQDPYKSTNYEFGATWEFLPRISLNANAYFREVENFINYSYVLQGLVGQTVTTYSVQFNSGYADARGVELTLNLGQYSIADIVNVAGRVNYTWSVIKGPSQGPALNKTGYARNTADSVFTQLPFDDVKSFKQFEINIQGGASVLGAGFDRTHRVGYALSFRFPYELLLNVVGTHSSGFLYTNPTVDNRTARQLETGPSNNTVDVRVEKGFLFAGKRLGVFMDVKNIFNKGNILATATSGGGLLKFYNTGDPTGDYNRSILPEGTSVYDLPRQVYVGAYVEF